LNYRALAKHHAVSSLLSSGRPSNVLPAVVVFLFRLKCRDGCGLMHRQFHGHLPTRGQRRVFRTVNHARILYRARIDLNELPKVQADVASPIHIGANSFIVLGHAGVVPCSICLQGRRFNSRYRMALVQAQRIMMNSTAAATSTNFRSDGHVSTNMFRMADILSTNSPTAGSPCFEGFRDAPEKAG
jgi:hypothetical protein